MFGIHLVYHQDLPKFNEGVTGSKVMVIFRAFPLSLEDCSLSHRRQTVEPKPCIFGEHLVYHQALPKFKDGFHV